MSWATVKVWVVLKSRAAVSCYTLFVIGAPVHACMHIGTSVILQVLKLLICVCQGHWTCVALAVRSTTWTARAVVTSVQSAVSNRMSPPAVLKVYLLLAMWLIVHCQCSFTAWSHGSVKVVLYQSVWMALILCSLTGTSVSVTVNGTYKLFGMVW